MSNADSQHIIIGQIGSPYGVKGWIKINAYTDRVTNVLEYNPWYVENVAGWKCIQIQASHAHGKGVIVKLKGFETPEQVKLLAGKKIAVLRSQLPPLTNKEYYWNDLQGLTVIDQHGHSLGKVIYLIETGANDVLVVKGDKEHAIPYLPGKVVIRVDLVKQELHVNWEVI